MFTLLGEIGFWGNQDLEISNNDFSVIKHSEKKVRNESLYDEGKIDFFEKRGAVSNKKLSKLKDLEEVLQHNKIIFCKWKTNKILQLVTASASIISIEFNCHTGTIEQVVFDGYFVGKLDSDIITDVALLKSHIIFGCNENVVTVAYLSKPSKSPNIIEKLNKAEIQIQTQELAGIVGKCKISANQNGDLIAIWRFYNGDEVQPWSPSHRDQTNANIFIYSLTRTTKLDFICSYRTEFDPICVVFCSLNAHVLNTVEQKISSKGLVTAETCSYEIPKSSGSQLVRTTVISIPLQKQICCHCFNTANRKLVLGCIDGAVVLYDHSKGTTHVVKSQFIPMIVNLNQDGSMISVVNDQGKMQFFDISLSAVNVQLNGNESSPTPVLDFSQYFKSRPSLLKMKWSQKPEAPVTDEDFMPCDSMIFLLFDRGPLAVLRLISSTGVRTPANEMGYSPDVLIQQYLSMGLVDKANNVLLSMDWNFWGTICLICLNRIFNFLMRQRFTSDTEAQIQTALSSYYAPVRPLLEEVVEEFGDSVKSISRRFFHLLVRYKLFEKAFRLAIDIGDHDLFMDLNYYAWVIKDYELALAAKNKALQLI